VTVVQRDSQLLPQEDADIAGAVLEILRDDGIEVLLGTEARCATRDGEGLKLEVTAADGPRILRGTHVVVATGRVPNTDRLNLGAAGVRTDARGFVIVNERLETTASGVYALGDVKGGPAFTHISYDDFRIVRTNLLQGGNATTTGRLVPYTVFLDPQLGRVGLSEREAVKQGRDHRVVKMPMTRVARALEVDESRGVMKALVDPGSGRLLGAAVLGLEGGELMSMLQLAIMGNLRYSDLRDAVFAHPTLAESFNNLFSVLED
jgi:pyruvate/2-oxoglutarate dehydrogenase complex dihydrolipoamide dehydrogenase (E3) component